MTSVPPRGMLGESTWIQPLTAGAMGSPVSCVIRTEIVPLGAMFKAQRRGTSCEKWAGPPDSLNSVANTVIHCPVGLDRINVDEKPLPLTTWGAIQSTPVSPVTERPFTRIRDGPAPSAACARTGPLALIRASDTWVSGAILKSTAAWASMVAERVRTASPEPSKTITLTDTCWAEGLTMRSCPVAGTLLGGITTI